MINRLYSSKPVQGFKKIVTFVWSNIPTTLELFIFSSIQSFIEIVFDTDKKFGNNPVEKSFIRDFAKIPGEYTLAKKTTHFGTTDYWHDSFSLFSTIQKPILKLLIIWGYESSYRPNTTFCETNLQKLVAKYNIENVAFPKSISEQLEQYQIHGITGKASRLANFIGEPTARLIGGLGKKHQDFVISTFKLQSPSDTPLIQDAEFTKFKFDSNMNLHNVPKFIAKNGINKMPYAFTYSSLKIIGLDNLGKLYGKLDIKHYFKEARSFLDTKIFRSFDSNFPNISKKSFYERKDIIWSQENLNYKEQILSTISTFTLECTEKTLYNMFTMTFFSTPNKILGNILHMLDNNINPYIFRTIGMVLGGLYIQKEFFDDTTKKKETNFTKFIQAQGTAYNSEESCYANFIDEILEHNNLSFPKEYNNDNAYSSITANLVTCLDEANTYSSDSLTSSSSSSIPIGDMHAEL